MKTPYQVIKKPLITEKTTILREENKFTLVVDRNATKADIQQAAEDIFDIKGKILKPKFYGPEKPAYLHLSIPHCPDSFFSERMF